MPELYAASLDTIPLEIEEIDDEIQKDIVRHEYPYRNGALLEDMGEGARMVRFRCHFWDDGVDHQTYAFHQDLLDHIEGLEIFELVHPNYGPLRGRVESVHLHHTDGDSVEIDLVFVEQLIEDADEQPAENVASSADEAYSASIEEQKDLFSSDMQMALGPEYSSILGISLDPNHGILEQFSSVSTTARSYLKQVDTYVGKLEGTLNMVANPANSLVSIINYGTSLPGRVIGSVARCIERYAVLADTIRTAPARFTSSLADSLDELASTSGSFSKTTKVGGAAHIALQTAYCYQDDEDLRIELKRTEGVPAFDSLGRYTGQDEATTQPMTVAELESSLATVRGLLQEAVSLARESSGGLKKLALQLQTHVGSVKLERENTIQVRVENPMPLHLICLIHGLPYTAADRLLSVNPQITNPNEVSGVINMLIVGASIRGDLVVTAPETYESVVDGEAEVTLGGSGLTLGGDAVNW